MKTLDTYTLQRINALLSETQDKITELCGSNVIVQYIMIDSNISRKPIELQIQITLEVVSRYFNIPISVLLSTESKRPISNARFMAFKLLKDIVNLNKMTISRLFNRNHATIIHGMKKFDNYYTTETDFRNDYDTLFNKLNLNSHE